MSTYKTPTGQQTQLQHLSPEQHNFIHKLTLPSASPWAVNSTQHSIVQLAASPCPRNAREENRLGPRSPAPAVEVFALLINSHYKQL